MEQKHLRGEILKLAITLEIFNNALSIFYTSNWQSSMI